MSGFGDTSVQKSPLDEKNAKLRSEPQLSPACGGLFLPDPSVFAKKDGRHSNNSPS
jgi:hypothetical protein